MVKLTKVFFLALAARSHATSHSSVELTEHSSVPPTVLDDAHADGMNLEASSWAVPEPWATQETPGCFYKNARYERADLQGVTNPVKFIHTALECQQMCQRAPGCKVFGYFPTAETCYLSGDGGLLSWSPGTVAGPRRCLQVPSSCTALPALGFPGRSSDETAKLWPSGGNPTKLQCWPWNEFGQPAYCRAEKVTVLDGKATAGRCLGLTKVELPGGESCELNCARNVMCPSWQEVVVPNKDSKGNTVECWQGVGRDCFFKRGLVHQNAGRFMHGHYRVLANIQHVQVMGLQKVFDSQDNAFANHAEAIRHCNHTCLSLLTCEVWQYSTERGCYIEDPAKQAISYPPTSATWVKDSAFAQTAIAGQYIQRLCGLYGPDASGHGGSGRGGASGTPGVLVPVAWPEPPALPAAPIAPMMPLPLEPLQGPPTRPEPLGPLEDPATPPAPQEPAAPAHVPAAPEAAGPAPVPATRGVEAPHPPPAPVSPVPVVAGEIPAPAPPLPAAGEATPAPVSPVPVVAGEIPAPTPPLPAAGEATPAPVSPVPVVAGEIPAPAPPLPAAGEATPVPVSTVPATGGETVPVPPKPATGGETPPAPMPPLPAWVRADVAPTEPPHPKGIETTAPPAHVAPPSTTTTVPGGGHFITSGKEVFWQDPVTKQRHLVPPSLDCNHCKCRGSVVWVDETVVTSLDEGHAFDCKMIPPAPVPVRGRFIDTHAGSHMVYFQENSGALHPVGVSGCEQCGCKSVLLVDIEYVKMLPQGEVFNCDMVPKDSDKDGVPDLVVRAQRLSSARGSAREAREVGVGLSVGDSGASFGGIKTWAGLLVIIGTCLVAPLGLVGGLILCSPKRAMMGTHSLQSLGLRCCEQTDSDIEDGTAQESQ